MQAKKNQHYVWEHYLRAWVCNKQNEVWSSHNGNVSRRPISRIASSEYFYEVKPVNDDEKKYFQIQFLLNYPNDVQEQMLKYIDTLNTPFRLNEELGFAIFLVSTKFGGYENIPEDIRNEFKWLKMKNDAMAKNIVEERHGEVETQAVKWLNALKDENLDFFDFNKPLVTLDDHLSNEGYNFTLFVCMQYFRTKRRIERMTESIKRSLKTPEATYVFPACGVKINNVRPEHITPHYLRFLEIVTAYGLWGAKANLTLLVNDTERSFITSDQPVINLKADYQNRGKKNADGIIFYYPISPRLAITVNDSGDSRKISLNADQVNTYNKAMLNADYKNAFSNTKDCLIEYFNDSGGI